MELSGNRAAEAKKKRIIPRHILLAVKQDGELDVLCRNVTIPEGGVLPNIHKVLLPKLTQERLDRLSQEQLEEGHENHDDENKDWTEVVNLA